MFRNKPTIRPKNGHVWIVLLLTIPLLACGLNPLAGLTPTPLPTPTLVVARFGTPDPTATPAPVLSPTSTSSPTATTSPPATPTATTVVTPTATTDPNSQPTPEPPVSVAETAESDPPAAVEAPAEAAPPAEPTPDFVVRMVRLRTNEENSWEGTLGPGNCGSDHSIYVYVADAQERRLDHILIGDKFGNFEVPTGVDDYGMVRILVWSATMELTVVGSAIDGARYTSEFTPPLSTLDEQIPLAWLEEAGYCDSPEDCQWRVENNQLCRGHYSYDVIFQRTW